MEEAPKPFPCKAVGCGMSFTNEDHLNVHEKKRHEMVLNLSTTNKSTIFHDQTPTPTRLIKNCEEVGLFDDLKHVNPFDETFRRAVESKNDEHHLTDNDTEILKSNDESLHTPQVFSYQPTTERGNSVTEDFKVEKEKVYLREVTQKPKKVRGTKARREILRNNKKITKPTDKTLNSGSCLAISRPIILPSSVKIKPGELIAVNILPKELAQSSRPILLPKPETPPVKKVVNTYITVKERLRAVLVNQNGNEKANEEIVPAKPISRGTIKRPSSSTASTNEKNYELERRRAAAFRYRRKVKQEQSELKRQNAQLLAENNELKKRINDLEQRVAAHKNCEFNNVSSIVNSPIILGTPVTIPPSSVRLLINVPKINNK